MVMMRPLFRAIISRATSRQHRMHGSKFRSRTARMWQAWPDTHSSGEGHCAYNCSGAVSKGTGGGANPPHGTGRGAENTGKAAPTHGHSMAGRVEPLHSLGRPD